MKWLTSRDQTIPAKVTASNAQVTKSRPSSILIFQDPEKPKCGGIKKHFLISYINLPITKEQTKKQVKGHLTSFPCFKYERARRVDSWFPSNSGVKTDKPPKSLHEYKDIVYLDSYVRACVCVCVNENRCLQSQLWEYIHIPAGGKKEPRDI